MNAIYTITAIELNNDLRRGAHSTRCWGWFPNQCEAEVAVIANVGDMQECRYQYIVIERYNEGVQMGSLPDVVAWFRWHAERGWQPCQEPACFRYTINFAMG